ncbi:hydroxyacylglutathione hydrolase [Synchytrium microbalum]|uniref:hydroxyacylglutathione hydrolase n=1 Tax=Synchytrium microbalum TaxID=1806994 RepID=A0A507CDR6_9FUNG|nr:hydroxyacylglutathione hydrolase [Synchytrium microbalum]TPX36186.1 hydroxyacylglutathione hydrolase [Synchytrium microbalum]
MQRRLLATASKAIVRKMKITPIPCLSDNYAYLLLDEHTNKSALIDPVEPSKVLPVAKDTNITAVLTTHHHADHAGGNKGIASQLPHIPIYGGDDRIDALSHKVEDRVSFKIGSLDVTPMFTICHTKGSVSYYVVDASTGQKCVFTGDTLFVAGCGRFFEGTPTEMHHSLLDVLGNLPKETEVYCGHEYTASNLKFAAAVEPSNHDVAQKLEWAKNTKCTVPSTIGEEFKINPFMRLNSKEIIDKTGVSDPIGVMGKLREMKNKF